MAALKGRCVTCGRLGRKVEGELEPCNIDDRSWTVWDSEKRGIPTCGEEHTRLEKEWQTERDKWRGKPGEARWPVGEIIYKDRKCPDWGELDITATPKEHREIRDAERRANRHMKLIIIGMILTAIAALLSGPITALIKKPEIVNCSPPVVNFYPPATNVQPIVNLVIPELGKTIQAIPEPVDNSAKPTPDVW